MRKDSTGLKMDYDKEIAALESEWSPDGGFFWRVRQGQFFVDRFQVVIEKISQISVREDAALPRRLISLLWYAPLFMSWQIERVHENGGDDEAYRRAIDLLTSEIERILGIP